MSDLTGPVIDPQTSHTDRDIFLLLGQPTVVMQTSQLQCKSQPCQKQLGSECLELIIEKCVEIGHRSDFICMSF